jgi:hypothetical protein
VYWLNSPVLIGFRGRYVPGVREGWTEGEIDELTIIRERNAQAVRSGGQRSCSRW